MKTATLEIAGPWKDIFNKENPQHKRLVEQLLPAYLRKMRWFAAKTSPIKRYGIEQHIELDLHGGGKAYILFLEVVFETSNSENYLLPVSLSPAADDPLSKICEVKDPSGKSLGFLIDAVYDEAFRYTLFELIASSKKIPLDSGSLRFSKGKRMRGDILAEGVSSRVLKVEQSNTTVVYNDKYFLKIYRKLFRNNNPDLELTRFLSEKSNFPHSPFFAGSIEWVRADFYTVSLGLMQEKVENQGEAWNDTLNEIEGFFKRVLELDVTPEELPKLDLYKPIALEGVPPYYQKLVGEAMLEKVKKLAIRTAELHLALAADKSDRHFNPESFSSDYTVWLLNRVMYMYDRRFHLLEHHLGALKGRALEYATYLIEHKDLIKDRLLNFDDLHLNSCRIRIHGDYHLGQVLITDGDFCILDFEGEPESTIRDRKVKQPPIKDLAGLFRSYHYAVFATIFQRMEAPGEVDRLTEIGGRYYRLLVGLSLHYYMQTAMDGGLNIGYAKEIDFLLRYHLFEKAIYELGYELHARPDWVVIPLKGIMQIINND